MSDGTTPHSFVVNVAEASALRHSESGTIVRFEDPERPFQDFGVNIRVLQPGQPSAKYHSEAVQEGFLVLSGECLAVIDGEQRRLGPWDFVHCGAGAAHVFIADGETPCAILMVGSRRQPTGRRYLPDEFAAGYGASVTAETASADEAYADWSSEFTPTTYDWPPTAG